MQYEPNATKAAAGWYVDKRWPGEQRRWDGQRWLDQWRPTPSKDGPAEWMVAGISLGVGLGILSGILLTLNETAGWVALWISAAVAGIVFNIGAIGKAVEIGVRAARR